jgi:hypothetical protein
MDVTKPVQAQLDAYNRKDLDGLMAAYAADSVQLELHGKVLAKGHDEMRQRYIERFQEPDLHARLVSRAVVGQFVMDIEIITRNFPDGRGTVEMLCIYEVQDGLIVRASFKTGAVMLCA